MAIVAVVTLAGAAAILATALHAQGHRPVLWMVFLSFLLVGAAVALARTADEPKLEPVAVLLKGPSEQIGGFYVGESDGRVHIAQLRHGVDVPWTDARKAPDETGRSTHPRAYVAKGSHATYRRAGRFVQVLVLRGVEAIRKVDDARACPECPLWFTWQRLVRATSEPWYGFGGAWGQVGAASDFTGPLGPSPAKTLGRSAAPETSLQQASEGAGR